MKKNEIDMLNGPITGRLLQIALPVAAIMILQQLFNAADVAVVGRFASAAALAAVGANTAIINMFVTFFNGLATGGNIAISNLIGRGEKDKVNRAVHTVFTLSLVSAVLMVIVGEIIAEPLLRLTNAPEEIMGQAVLYLRIYLFAVLFSVIYSFCSAILRSKGDTKRPLYCLVVSGILNLLLNLLLVIVFHLDVAGVAIATLISNMVCAAAAVYLLLKEEDCFRLSFRKLELERKTLLFTLRIGLPAGLQGMLFSVSNIILQTAINSFGSDCIAGNTAAMNFEFIAYFFINAFGQAATTYISQNYGASQFERCKRVFRISLLMGFLFTAVVSGVFYAGRYLWLSLFTAQKEVLRFGLIRMLLVVALEPLTAFNEMAAAGLRAMGISLIPAIISVSGSCVFRIIWVNTVFRLYHRIETIMLVYPVSWILLGIAMTTVYYGMRKKRMIFSAPK